MTDTHTLDDYHRALSVVTTKGPVSVHVVSCKVHGIGRGLDMHDTTELALDELVAQCRADRDISGRYRARTLAADGWPGRGGIPPIRQDEPQSSSEILTRAAEEQEDRDPDAAPYGGQSSSDPAFTVPHSAVDAWEDDGGATAPTAPDQVAYAEPEVHPAPAVHAAAGVVHAEPGPVQDDLHVHPTPEVTVRHCPVVGGEDDAPRDALRTIEEVAARHAPRPELDSVEAVLEEAAVLRKRTEVALAVARTDVEEANAREAAAREAHEAAFRAAKAKSDRLRQVRELASQLGVEAQP